MAHGSVKTFLGVLLSILACNPVWAQSTAQIGGVVTDQTGAVLPGVEVAVTQTATGAARTDVTDETGAYQLANLPIGPYRLEASLPGFQTHVQTGIVLQVGSNAGVNIALQVGQIGQTIEVESDVAMVETRSTGVSQMIDNTRVLEMPLNGRQVTELVLLSGAAIMTGTGGSRGYPTIRISVAGGQDNGLTYLLDGATHNDPYQNNNLPMPFPDALQEFKVETSAVPAQYGYHSAGTVNAVTKSGTNEFHGNLFEFVRNGVFNARNAFAPVRDGLKRNQYGGTFGGPIVKGKLFFFGGYQGTTFRSVPVERRLLLPTAAMMAGDWTAFTSPACNAGRQIAMRTPFVNNRISPTQFSPAAVKLISYFDLPSDPCGQVTYGISEPVDEHGLMGRVDYQLSERHSLFGRYVYAYRYAPPGYDGRLITMNRANDDKAWAHSVVLGSTYLLGTGTVNSFRAALNRPANSTEVPEDIVNMTDLGSKGFYQPPHHKKILRIAVTGTSLSGPPGHTNSTIFQFVDDISTVRGAHQVGFGASYLNRRMNILGSTSVPMQLVFTTQATGTQLGDLMLGRVNSFVQTADETYYFRQHYAGTYLQDTWRVNSRLTLNLGVRWEPFLSPYSKDGRVYTIDKTAFEQGIRSTVYKKAPAGILFYGDKGGPESKSVTNNHLLHFAPRLGLAWDPSGDGRTTVRAAYGIFFDKPPLYLYYGLRAAPPWGFRVDITNPPGGLDDPWGHVPGGNPLPITLNSDIEFPLTGTYVNFPRDTKAPYVNQWNLSVQKQVGADWAVAANYIGSQIIHLIGSVAGNPSVYLPGASCVIHGETFSPCSSTNNTDKRRELYLKNPSQGRYYGSILQLDDDGTRSYNALWLSLQRRRARGLTLQTNYTWAHCIGNGMHQDFNPSGRGGLLGRRGADRGNCDSDVRHNFTTSTVYEMPQFSNPALRVLAGGWRVSGILRFQAGRYMTVTSGLDNSLTATDGQRPDQILGDPYAPNKSVDQYFNPAAFRQPADGTFGNVGTFSLRGPGSIGIDMGLTRVFQIRENQSLEFRAEAFNLPNHMNPGNPITDVRNARFGQIQTASDPRIMQLALKYVF